jgi:alpha-tubulin suppressor-like RCC1 family protein
MAANPKLQTIDVTPAAKTISIGQKQSFTATGTFSNGSKHALGPALSDIAPGYRITCAVLVSGGVECWGYNARGELGDGTTVDSLSPRPVQGITNATAVKLSRGDIDDTSNGGHGCARLSTGAVRCWGGNTWGQLGNGTWYGNQTSPVAVIGIGTATAVDVGDTHSCALLASGAVQCWGDGELGQLGNGFNAEIVDAPVAVIGIGTATALALGVGHSCALLASGAVRCWGDNSAGALGNGTTTSSNTPVAVSGIGNATAIAAGEAFSCALLASGGVKCWGVNVAGELGNGTYANSSTPVAVTGISTAVAITAGGGQACAVLSNGAAKCWGANAYGDLGDGTNTISNIPVRVHTINGPTRLAAGYAHTCALFSGGVMRCWGLDNYGQLGNRRTTGENVNALPVTVVGTPGVVWSSSNSTKATITDRGVATGRAAGNTTISATTTGFINDNAVLTVK